MIYFILLFFIASIKITAQDDAILKLFPGRWKMDIVSPELYEEWKQETGTELVGISYKIDEQKKFVSEYLYLKKFGDKWTYIAHPINQNITMFALVESTAKKFVFENKEHDFPQRIIYEFQKDGKLYAAIEGEINGELKRKEFSYSLAEEY